MLIIVEGPDGAGKTTFVESLQRELAHNPRGAEDIITLHCGPPSDHVYAEYTKNHLHGYSPMQLTHVVCDRWHWGELIYGPMLRGESKLDRHGFDRVEHYLARRGAVVAFLTEKAQILARRVEERGDELVKVDQLPYLVAAYDVVASWSRLPVLVGPTTQEIIETAVAFEASARRVTGP